MKKKIVAIMLASMLAVSATACGGSEESSGGNDTTQVSDNSNDSEASEESEQVTEQEPEQEDSGEVQEENGMRKEPVYTNKELGISGETGTFKYSIDAIQVSKLTATTDEAAQLLGIEKDKEIALVVVDVSAENTSDDTAYFYLGQATLTSNTKEQVDPDMLLSDYIDGEYIGNVIHNGSMMYLLQNSSADDITSISLHIDAPTDSDFNTIGDEVSIDIPVE